MMVDIVKCKYPINQSIFLYKNQNNLPKCAFNRNNNTNIGRKLNSLSSQVQSTSKTNNNLVRPSSNMNAVDKLQVLKIMNREKDSPGPQMRKLSKYLPLPNIKGTMKTVQKQAKPPPPLIREKTYDVLEPIYVKGPMDITVPKFYAGEKRFQKRKPELPQIEEKPSRTVPPRQKPLKTSERPKSRRSSQRTNELGAPRKKPSPNHLPVGNIETRTIKDDKRVIKQVYKFNPSVVNDDGPAHTVFWFPV